MPDPDRDSEDRGTGRDTSRDTGHGTDRDTDHDTDLARRRKRAMFLRELNEAKELRERVQPRRARVARMRQQMRMRTFRW